MALANQLSNLIIAAYARVSTDKQGESVDHQIMLAREIAKKEFGVEIPDHLVYIDEDVSATKTVLWERPTMKTLLQHAGEGKFQIVIFKSISRFARDAEEAIGTVNRLRSKGIRIIAKTDSFDSETTPLIVFNLLSSIAEQEAKNISHNVYFGRQQKAKLGLWAGGQAPDGYNCVNDKLVSNDRASVIRDIFDMYVNGGMGCRAIAIELNKRGIKTKKGNLWTHNGIKIILTNENYTGTLVYNKIKNEIQRSYDDGILQKKRKQLLHDEEDWVVVPNAHESIISREIFDKASSIRSTKVKTRAVSTVHPLSGGIAVCGKCGKNLFVVKRNKSGKTYRYYVCSSRYQFGSNACEQKGFNADLLEELVYDQLHEELSLIRYNEDFWNAYNLEETKSTDVIAKVKKLEKELEKNRNNMMRLFTEKDDMGKDQYLFIQKRLKDEAMSLNQQVRDLNYELHKIVSGTDERDMLKHQVEDFFQLHSKENLKETLAFFVEKIEVKEKMVTIEYKFDAS